MLSTQWFVKMKPLATPAVAAVEHGFTKFWPKQWENLYFSWLRDVKDWCISRQLWWGHRIPAWHCAACSATTVARETPSQCGSCGSTEIKQDDDVLDTWFSSALWPFSTLGWPDKTPDLARYYPTSVLVTGFDIIFFWVARMMFAGTHLMGAVPFENVYLHGLVRDEHGDKMSKTKGNVVDPLEALEQFGVDAVRMTLISLSGLGRDVLWNVKQVDASVRFQNKVWQAFRFLRMHVQEVPAKPAEISEIDKWILARTGAAIQAVRAALDSYRFDAAASEVHAFIWYELCDWYLEFSKGALYGEAEEPKAAARWTLYTVFHAVARLLHPFMPFLSEEIWQHLPGTAPSTIMLASYPKASEFPTDPAAIAEVALLQEAIVSIRRVRSEFVLGKATLNLVVGPELHGILAPYTRLLNSLAGAGLEARTDAVIPKPAAALMLGGHEALLPLAGLVDIAREQGRLKKEIEKAQKDVNHYQSKLNNPGFMAKSPPAIISETQAKLAVDLERLTKLSLALSDLG
jgi:valyl-tRNA synthetase